MHACVQEQARLTNLAPVDIDQIPVDETEDGGGLSAAAIGGIVGGLLAVLLAIAAAVFIVHRKRKREQSSTHKAAMDAYAGNAVRVSPGRSQLPLHRLRMRFWTDGYVSVLDSSGLSERHNHVSSMST